ncbi:MAG: M48 family metallopeptidase [Lachnospiraceae bacterium]|nr:M48 family metallopeptidase [Lachnospiraceae bacterium]
MGYDVSMNYRVEIIRSKRKSLGLEISRPGLVTVRAPYGLSEKRIEKFLVEKELWLYENLERIAKSHDASSGAQIISGEELQRLGKEAVEKIPPLVEKWAGKMGVSYGRITIRHQKTRWGSCSGAGNLNFNCLLMLVPQEIREYVVIHELAHRVEMNHSKAFWKIVEEYDPEYEAHRKWLKNEGIKFRVE